MDQFVEYLETQRIISEKMGKNTFEWENIVRVFKHVYMNRFKEIDSYSIHIKASNKYEPEFSGTRYEIRKFIGHLYSLNAYSANSGNLGNTYHIMNRSEREFNGLIKMPINRLINKLIPMSKMIANTGIDIPMLSKHLFQWENQKKAENPDYIITAWITSYYGGKL